MPQPPVQIPLLIGDRRVVAGDDLTLRDPWDDQPIARVALATPEHLWQAIDAAHAALAETTRQPPAERAELLLRVAAAVAARRDELAQTIRAEAGKPITLAEGEVDRAILTFTSAADVARSLGDQALPADAYGPGVGYAAVVRRVPVGVVYGMSPFNFPLNLVAHKLAPVIASGGSIVLKPSPRTPLSALRLAELILECQAVPGQVNVVPCANELAMLPLEDRRVRAVSFTGSAPVGWKIKSVANQLKVILELGGNAAVIVHDDADLESAASMCAAGAFAYAGQSCISVQRVLVQQRVYDRFRDLLIGQTRKLVTGDPSDRATLNGPLIDPAARERVLHLIDDARARGATILAGGRAQGPCVTPTLLDYVPTDHKLWRDEAFAPVAVLKPYDDFDDALRLTNDSDFGLQAGVFTHDERRIEQAFAALEVGGVLINQVPTFRLDHLPYGGVKQSGFGREGPRWAVEELTEPRTLIVRKLGG